MWFALRCRRDEHDRTVDAQRYHLRAARETAALRLHVALPAVEARRPDGLAGVTMIPAAPGCTPTFSAW